MTQELREKVRERTMHCAYACKPNANDCQCMWNADAAIALIRAEVLEEAAKLADAEPPPKYSDDNYDAAASYWYGRKEAAVEIAAAIRALKEKP